MFSYDEEKEKKSIKTFQKKENGSLINWQEERLSKHLFRGEKTLSGFLPF